MNYTELQVGERIYKLRINTRNTVSLEKQLGCNPLMIFGNGDRVPTVTEMCAILHAAAQQYEHCVTLQDAYDIFDNWIAEGHTVTDFISVIVDLYKASGLISAKN